MIKYIIRGHNFYNEVQSMVQVFYPNLHYIQVNKLENGIVILSIIKNNISKTILYNDRYKVDEAQIEIEFSKNKFLDDKTKELKRFVKLSIYKLLSNITNQKPDWGILTGIRPTKNVHSFWDEGANDCDIKQIFNLDYLVSPNKIDLTLKTARAENKVLSSSKPNSVSIYIGIPFCATTCLYCSFTSFPLNKYKNRVDKYILSLLKEMEFIADCSKKYTIETIYVGGGTPTALDEVQFELLLKSICKYFDINNIKEFTVEAGRPDTITDKKLELMKDYGVSRISINPQTMNQKTLDIIGRSHTVEDIINVFNKARMLDYQNINMDIILGLPGENLEDIKNTFKSISKLEPDNLTVHTLAVKRASRLKQNLDMYKFSNNLVKQMLNLSLIYTEQMNLYPYYMYRQKNMVGNFENVGYCKPNKECIYNIEIMEEKQSILSIGAGASTKIVYNNSRIERIFNFKNLDDYILRIDELIEKKKLLL